jgi:hypothetical protein
VARKHLPSPSAIYNRHIFGISPRDLKKPQAGQLEIAFAILSALNVGATNVKALYRKRVLHKIDKISAKRVNNSRRSGANDVIAAAVICVALNAKAKSLFIS